MRFCFVGRVRGEETRHGSTHGEQAQRLVQGTESPQALLAVRQGVDGGEQRHAVTAHVSPGDQKQRSSVNSHKRQQGGVVLVPGQATYLTTAMK